MHDLQSINEISGWAKILKGKENRLDPRTTQFDYAEQ